MLTVAPGVDNRDMHRRPLHPTSDKDVRDGAIALWAAHDDAVDLLAVVEDDRQ